MRAGSPAAAQAAIAARPRYHVAAGRDVFFSRPPYLNRDLGAGVRATRFVGLAPAGSATKQKSLHALALVPASEMMPDQLQQRPEGCTPSPFEAAASDIGRKRAAGQDDLGAAGAWEGCERARARGVGGDRTHSVQRAAASGTPAGRARALAGRGTSRRLCRRHSNCAPARAAAPAGEYRWAAAAGGAAGRSRRARRPSRRRPGAAAAWPPTT